MTMDANEQIIALLTDILAELRKAPAARAPAASGAKKTDAHNGTLVPPDADWARFPIPGFFDGKGYMADRQERTFGDCAKTEAGRKGIAFWVTNYTGEYPKGSGKIPPKNQEIRDMLDAMRDWLASPSSSPEAAGAAPSRPAAPPDRSPQYNPGPADNDAPPF